MRYTAYDDVTATHGRGPERVKLQGRAQLVLGDADDQLPMDVTLEDLSCSGAGMISPLNLEEGTSAVLLLHSPDHSPHGVRGQIVSSTPITKGQFRIGMQFEIAGGLTIERIRHAFFPDDELDKNV